MTLLYNPPLVIVRAEFVGFLKKHIGPEFCTHSSCGYDKDGYKCPKCDKKVRSFTYGHFYACTSKNCGKVVETFKRRYLASKGAPVQCAVHGCGQKMEAKYGAFCPHCNEFGTFKKVAKRPACQRRLRFKGLTRNEVHDPERDIRYAAIQVHYTTGGKYPDLTSGAIIVDLQERTFLPDRWQANSSYDDGERKVKTIYKSGSLDTSNMICSEDLIAAIWEKA